MQIFAFLNNALLKMTWLFAFFQFIVERVFGLSLQTRIGNSVHFFLYDTVKILLLLSVLIFGVSYIQSYFPPEKTKKILGHFQGIRGNFMGSLLGVLTPF